MSLGEKATANLGTIFIMVGLLAIAIFSCIGAVLLQRKKDRKRLDLVEALSNAIAAKAQKRASIDVHTEAKNAAEEERQQLQEDRVLQMLSRDFWTDE